MTYQDRPDADVPEAAPEAAADGHETGEEQARQNRENDPPA
jgi:hypothetical protein